MGIVIPEVLNHYNVYNDKAKKLIGISGEIELPELEALKHKRSQRVEHHGGHEIASHPACACHTRARHTA